MIVQFLHIQNTLQQFHFDKFYPLPKTRSEYWYNELEGNKERDFTNKSRLKELGWKVIDLWECTLVKKELPKTMQKLERMLSLTLN